MSNTTTTGLETTATSPSAVSPSASGSGSASASVTTPSNTVTTTPSATLTSNTQTTPSQSPTGTTTSLTTASDTTTTIPASSSFTVTSVVSESASAPSTAVVTSVVTRSNTNSDGQTTAVATTVIVTSQVRPTGRSTTTRSSTTNSADAAAASSSAAALQDSGNSSSSSSGLSTGGKTAIAVVVPVVVVALLVAAGLFFWRRRKQRQDQNQALREQVEDYNYNPNHDPTLPAIASDGHSEMTQTDGNGYRGWGATNVSNRKASTTLSNGHTQQLSDSGSSPTYATSPVGAHGSNGSDDHSGDPIMDKDVYGSGDDLGALGGAPAAGAYKNDMHRGKSNASSQYSAGARSDHSDVNYSYPANSDGYGYPYGQPTPYGESSYGAPSMPVVRDVSARRNMQVEQGGGHQQGNRGIAQNF